jgi:hypothetical protein
VIDDMIETDKTADPMPESGETWYQFDAPGATVNLRVVDVCATWTV